MSDLAWSLASREGHAVVRAAMAHLNVVMIHPGGRHYTAIECLPPAGPAHRLSHLIYILLVVHRTSIELDETLLDESRRILGTTGIRDTVEGAMRELIRAERRGRLRERVRTGDGVDRGVGVLEATRPAR